MLDKVTPEPGCTLEDDYMTSLSQVYLHVYINHLSTELVVS